MDAASLTLRIVNAMLGRGRGGLEQALLDYQDALRLFGHDVHAVIHPNAAIRPALEASHASWHGLSHLGAWDVVAAMRLRLLLRSLQPDLCIAHGNRAMSLLRQAGAHPLVAVLPNYKMKCAGAAGVFYPTLDLRRYAVGQGVAEFRLHHIPSMVELPASAPVRTSRAVPVIGAMGRFVAKKGFDVFIAALGQLRAQGVAFQAILAGDGPDRNALEQQASAQGLDDRLVFPGWVNDKAAFFAAIDAFCLPSHHEPFGIVLLEAMAQATPIVATDSEGPSEILRPGVDGIVVPRNDAASLAAALGSVIENPDHARRMSGSAYRRVQEDFAMPVVAAKLDRAVARVVETAAPLPQQQARSCSNNLTSG